MDELIRLLPWIAFVFILIWVLITNVIPKVKKYRKRNRMLDEIDEKYEGLRKLRTDLIYHIDWARERGERKKAEELELEIERIEVELETLRNRYNEIEAGRVDISKLQ